MRIAILKAKEIYENYGNDLKVICREFDLEVLEEALEGRLKEVYFGDSIVIRENLPEEEKKELIAHAVGHHLMHAGNHIALQNNIYSFGNYHERQANTFAACLLIPKKLLHEKISKRLLCHELAEHFDVTERLVVYRIKIFTHFEANNELSYIS